MIFRSDLVYSCAMYPYISTAFPSGPNIVVSEAVRPVVGDVAVFVFPILKPLALALAITPFMSSVRMTSIDDRLSSGA